MVQFLLEDEGESSEGVIVPLKSLATEFLYQATNFKSETIHYGLKTDDYHNDLVRMSTVKLPHYLDNIPHEMVLAELQNETKLVTTLIIDPDGTTSFSNESDYSLKLSRIPTGFFLFQIKPTDMACSFSNFFSKQSAITSFHSSLTTLTTTFKNIGIENSYQNWKTHNVAKRIKITSQLEIGLVAFIQAVLVLGKLIDDSFFVSENVSDTNMSSVYLLVLILTSVYPFYVYLIYLSKKTIRKKRNMMFDNHLSNESQRDNNNDHVNNVNINQTSIISSNYSPTNYSSIDILSKDAKNKSSDSENNFVDIKKDFLLEQKYVGIKFLIAVLINLSYVVPMLTEHWGTSVLRNLQSLPAAIEWKDTVLLIFNVTHLIFMGFIVGVDYASFVLVNAVFWLGIIFVNLHISLYAIADGIFTSKIVLIDGSVVDAAGGLDYKNLATQASLKLALIVTITTAYLNFCLSWLIRLVDGANFRWSYWLWRTDNMSNIFTSMNHRNSLAGLLKRGKNNNTFDGETGSDGLNPRKYHRTKKLYLESPKRFQPIIEDEELTDALPHVVLKGLLTAVSLEIIGEWPIELRESEAGSKTLVYLREAIKLLEHPEGLLDESRKDVVENGINDSPQGDAHHASIFFGISSQQKITCIPTLVNYMNVGTYKVQLSNRVLSTAIITDILDIKDTSNNFYSRLMDYERNSVPFEASYMILTQFRCPQVSIHQIDQFCLGVSTAYRNEVSQYSSFESFLVLRYVYIFNTALKMQIPADTRNYMTTRALIVALVRGVECTGMQKSLLESKSNLYPNLSDVYQGSFYSLYYEENNVLFEDPIGLQPSLTTLLELLYEPSSNVLGPNDSWKESLAVILTFFGVFSLNDEKISDMARSLSNPLFDVNLETDLIMLHCSILFISANLVLASDYNYAIESLKQSFRMVKTNEQYYVTTDVESKSFYMYVTDRIIRTETLVIPLLQSVFLKTKVPHQSLSTYNEIRNSIVNQFQYNAKIIRSKSKEFAKEEVSIVDRETEINITNECNIAKTQTLTAFFNRLVRYQFIDQEMQRVITESLNQYRDLQSQFGFEKQMNKWTQTDHHLLLNTDFKDIIKYSQT